MLYLIVRGRDFCDDVQLKVGQSRESDIGAGVGVNTNAQLPIGWRIHWGHTARTSQLNGVSMSPTALYRTTEICFVAAIKSYLVGGIDSSLPAT